MKLENNNTLICAEYIFKGQFFQAYNKNHITFNTEQKTISFLEHIKLHKNISETFIDIPQGWNVVGNKYTINLSNTYNCNGLFKINNKQNQSYFSKIDSVGIFGTQTKLNKRRSYFCRPCPHNVVLSNCYNQCEINNVHCSAFLPLGCESCTILYSFNTGHITSSFCGGFITTGKNITIKNSFNIGNVHGIESSGFIQYVDWCCTILNCYYSGSIERENYVYFKTYIPRYRKNPIVIKNCYDTTNNLWTNVSLYTIDISNCYSPIVQHENFHDMQIFQELSSDFVSPPNSKYPILECFHHNVWNPQNYQSYRDIPIFKYEPELIDQELHYSYTLDDEQYSIIVLYFQDNTHEELYMSNLNLNSHKLFLSEYKTIHKNQIQTIEYLQRKQKENPIIGIQTSHNAIIHTSSHQIFLSKDNMLKVNPKSHIFANILYNLLNPINEKLHIIKFSKTYYIKDLQVKKNKLTRQKYEINSMPKNFIQYNHSNMKQLSSLWTKTSTRYYPYPNFKIDNKFV